MKRQKSLYICNACGYQSVSWYGKCPQCGAWDTLEETIQEASVSPSGMSANINEKELIDFSRPAQNEAFRVSTGIDELDRVLGGGNINGSLVLIGGDPGIGKSTLMLQMLATSRHSGKKVYISGEESFNQVKQRAARLKITTENLFFLNETNLETIVATLEKEKPGLVIVDSIQTISSASLDGIPGNSSQLRYCTNSLVHFAKHRNVPVFLIGHVTKDGSIAGPKLLEHLVDAVLYFEGETKGDFRILRCIKNRFGSVNEIALFRMDREGLIPVENASELFLSAGQQDQQGTAITAVMEGNRPILVEVQALVTKTQFGTPQRTATGIGHRRMNLLLAVLEKKCGKPFGFHDVFLKTAAGLRLDEPAADLAICMALISSMDETLLNRRTLYIGEVGLNGELRPVNHTQERILEAEKLGFKEILIPASSKTFQTNKAKIRAFKQIQDLI